MIYTLGVKVCWRSFRNERLIVGRGDVERGAEWRAEGGYGKWKPDLRNGGRDEEGRSTEKCVYKMAPCSWGWMRRRRAILRFQE